MREILETLPPLIDSGKRAAYCTVVEAKGSTPQKPGSKLVVLPDLRNIGTLGGGCVEAEARREAIGLMQSGGRKLFQFQLDDDYGWDDGLICGGQMHIFVDVPQTSEEASLFRSAEKLLAADTAILLATVVESNVQPSLVGNKLIVTDQGETFGSLGAEPLQALVLESASEHLRGTQPELLVHTLGSVFVEPVHPEPTLLIAGAGHIGQALCKLGAMIGFRVVVVDDRSGFASEERLPDAAEIHIGDIADTLANLPINSMTYAVIVTRGHRHDEEALYSVLDSGARYIGMIGSRRKVKLIFDDLLERGVSPESLERVHSPIGLDIHSQTVPEIAVSIAAQLILVRNAPAGTSLNQAPRPMPSVPR